MRCPRPAEVDRAVFQMYNDLSAQELLEKYIGFKTAWLKLAIFANHETKKEAWKKVPMMDEL
jgi:hypothetical protein